MARGRQSRTMTSSGEDFKREKRSCGEMVREGGWEGGESGEERG